MISMRPFDLPAPGATARPPHRPAKTGRGRGALPALRPWRRAIEAAPGFGPVDLPGDGGPPAGAAAGEIPVRAL